MQTNDERVEKNFEFARDIYEALGVDVEAAIRKTDTIPISMHCWQGDDLLGFEGTGELTGGIQTTGNYPGRARNGQELRDDIEQALRFIPGKTKVALHSIHAEHNVRHVDRDAYDVSLFSDWIDWANEQHLGLDFNPTFFSHPMMDGNFSLASSNEAKRRFWVEHGKRCREIANEIGKRTGQVCINNFWMPDGYKDTPADTRMPRERMIASLDEIFSTPYDPRYTLDALESKLFGLGIESYTVASHEFSLLYAMRKKFLYTLDAGHFHPTESVAAKLSAVMCHLQEAMLHISRGVRWDSDHVVVLNDELFSIMSEIVQNGYEQRVHIGLDYFDASINRVACWVIGVRNARKALLKAALDPIDAMRAAEREGNYTARLALMEEAKTLPYAAIWDEYCLRQNVGVGQQWLQRIERYEANVLRKR